MLMRQNINNDVSKGSLIHLPLTLSIHCNVERLQTLLTWPCFNFYVNCNDIDIRIQTSLLKYKLTFFPLQGRPFGAYSVATCKTRVRSCVDAWEPLSDGPACSRERSNGYEQNYVLKVMFLSRGDSTPGSDKGGGMNSFPALSVYDWNYNFQEVHYLSSEFFQLFGIEF